MTDAELANLDPAIQALAMLTGLSFTAELMLAVLLSNLPTDQARTMAAVMLTEWRARAALATVAAEGRGQVFEAADFCVERLLASAAARGDNIRTQRAANATAVAMATAPSTSSTH